MPQELPGATSPDQSTDKKSLADEVLDRKTTPQRLVEIIDEIDSNDPGQQMLFPQIAEHQNLSPEGMEALAEKDYPTQCIAKAVYLQLIFNKRTPADVLESLIDKVSAIDPAILINMSFHPNITPNIVIKLVETDEELGGLMATQPEFQNILAQR